MMSPERRRQLLESSRLGRTVLGSPAGPPAAFSDPAGKKGDLDPAGHWTTISGNNIHITADGEIDAGGPPVLRQILAEKAGLHPKGTKAAASDPPVGPLSKAARAIGAVLDGKGRLNLPDVIKSLPELHQHDVKTVVLRLLRDGHIRRYPDDTFRLQGDREAAQKVIRETLEDMGHSERSQTPVAAPVTPPVTPAAPSVAEPAEKTTTLADGSVIKYGRNDVKYDEWYSDPMKWLAKGNTVPELLKKLGVKTNELTKATKSHLTAIEKTGSMQGNSQHRAQSGNVVEAAGQERIYLRGALEIHALFPEHAKQTPTLPAPAKPAKKPKAPTGPSHRTEITEGKTVFKTGQPVTFRMMRNLQPAPKRPKGAPDQYQQAIEPAGRYMTHDAGGTGHTNPLPQYAYEEVTFKNPLVVPLNSGGPDGRIYDDNSWKMNLSREFGGKKGSSLSSAIARAGHDGIVTVDKYGTSEIVDLRHLHPKPDAANG